MALKDLFEHNKFELRAHPDYDPVFAIIALDLDEEDIEYFRNKYRPQLIKQLQHELDEISKQTVH